MFFCGMETVGQSAGVPHEGAGVQRKCASLVTNGRHRVGYPQSGVMPQGGVGPNDAIKPQIGHYEAVSSHDS